MSGKKGAVTDAHGLHEVSRLRVAHAVPLRDASGGSAEVVEGKLVRLGLQ